MESTDTLTRNQNLTIHWVVIASLTIALGSTSYWFLNTGQSIDEFITALSWGSLIAIVLGGLASFGARVTSSLAQFRKDPVEERHQTIDSSRQSKPAVFGMIASGILFLCITVTIEWIAKQTV